MGKELAALPEGQCIIQLQRLITQTAHFVNLTSKNACHQWLLAVCTFMQVSHVISGAAVEVVSPHTEFQFNAFTEQRTLQYPTTRVE